MDAQWHKARIVPLVRTDSAVARQRGGRGGDGSDSDGSGSGSGSGGDSDPEHEEGADDSEELDEDDEVALGAVDEEELRRLWEQHGGSGEGLDQVSGGKHQHGRLQYSPVGRAVCAGG